MKKLFVKEMKLGKTSWVHELEGNIVNMSVLPKAIYKFSTIPINISMVYLVEVKKFI